VRSVQGRGRGPRHADKDKDARWIELRDTVGSLMNAREADRVHAEEKTDEVRQRKSCSLEVVYLHANLMRRARVRRRGPAAPERGDARGAHDHVRECVSPRGYTGLSLTCASGWRAESMQRHEDTLNAVRATAQEQAHSNVQGVSLRSFILVRTGRLMSRSTWTSSARRSRPKCACCSARSASSRKRSARCSSTSLASPPTLPC
jgi:hypothetical protein